MDMSNGKGCHRHVTQELTACRLFIIEESNPLVHSTPKAVGTSMRYRNLRCGFVYQLLVSACAMRCRRGTMCSSRVPKMAILQGLIAQVQVKEYSSVKASLMRFSLSNFLSHVQLLTLYKIAHHCPSCFHHTRGWPRRGTVRTSRASFLDPRIPRRKEASANGQWCVPHITRKTPTRCPKVTELLHDLAPARSAGSILGARRKAVRRVLLPIQSL